MKISVIGTGYVGLVTGVALSEIGHHVTCVEIDQTRVNKLKQGVSPIYEPGLEEILIRNIQNGRLDFTTNHLVDFSQTDVIYIAVGTPTKEDGTVDLSSIEEVSIEIAQKIVKKVIVVTKSTVPVGTNDYIKQLIAGKTDVPFEVVSNPEFLRAGSAIYDTFHGDRIVIGGDNQEVLSTIEEINKPFGIRIYKTDLRSAEMIKYAANAFLATKISFINEISSLCEKLGANIQEVATGMGMDKRIGIQYLNAGIGYGGSCFPKDTNALVQIANSTDHDFTLLKEVMKVNIKQQALLVKKARERFGSLARKRIALLGLAFKPNTDDMREAASSVICQLLVKEGAQVVAYDPIAMENAKTLLPAKVQYAGSVKEVLKGADIAFILTEWDEFKQLDLSMFKNYMNAPIVFDGRNCYELEMVKKVTIEYHSIGRPTIKN